MKVIVIDNNSLYKKIINNFKNNKNIYNIEVFYNNICNHLEQYDIVLISYGYFKELQQKYYNVLGTNQHDVNIIYYDNKNLEKILKIINDIAYKIQSYRMLKEHLVTNIKKYNHYFEKESMHIEDKKDFIEDTIYTKSNVTIIHSLKVMHYSEILINSIYKEHKDFTDPLMTYVLGAGLHDIGKSFTPYSIIEKPGRLTPIEQIEMDKHSFYGYQVMKEINEYPILSEIAGHHHYNKIDNKNHYVTEIIRFIDIYDALTSYRSYKPTFKFEEVFKILDTNIASSHINNDVYELFLKNSYEFKELYSELNNDYGFLEKNYEHIVSDHIKNDLHNISSLINRHKKGRTSYFF